MGTLDSGLQTRGICWLSFFLALLRLRALFLMITLDNLSLKEDAFYLCDCLAREKDWERIS
jgi:hypothetical protein